MQLDRLTELIPSLKEKAPRCDKFVELLKRYKRGDWIYPAEIHRKLKIDIFTVYEMLEVLRKNHLLHQYLEMSCPYCMRFTGRCYKAISEIPLDYHCPHCKQEISMPFEYTVVTYKVL